MGRRRSGRSAAPAGERPSGNRRPLGSSLVAREPGPLFSCKLSKRGCDAVRPRVIVLAWALLMFAAPASARDPGEALYARAKALLQRAEAAESPLSALPLLEQAQAQLLEIVAQHPKSPIAARLLLGDPLEQRVTTALAAARAAQARAREACLQRPTAACLIELALYRVGAIEDANERASALRAIAEAQAEAGQFKAALVTARAIEPVLFRASALREIAAAQAKAGQVGAAARTFEAALATARAIEDASSRAFASP